MWVSQSGNCFDLTESVENRIKRLAKMHLKKKLLLMINIENDFFIDLFGHWTASFVATLRLFLIFEIINPWMELKLTTSHISSHKL